MARQSSTLSEMGIAKQSSTLPEMGIAENSMARQSSTLSEMGIAKKRSYILPEMEMARQWQGKAVIHPGKSMNRNGKSP